MCTGTRLLTSVAPTQVCGCADGEVGWGPTGQRAGHSKGWRGHRPAGRGASDSLRGRRALPELGWPDPLPLSVYSSCWGWRGRGTP